MSETKKVNVWKVLTIAFGIMLIISWINLFGGASEEQAKANVQAYLDTLQIQEEVVIGDVVKDHGLYKVTINIANQPIESYVSKDGNILFTQAIDLTVPPLTGSTTQEPKKTCEDIPKSEKPLLEVFVVSYCPYGTQMQRILSEIPLKDNIKVRYLGAIENGQVTAMHGAEEAAENLRQICIREEQPDKYWDYVNCFIKAGDSEGCLKSANIDTSALEICMAGKGIDYAKEDFDLQVKYQVQGSPTLILNKEQASEFDFGGRTAEAVKILLCCSYKDQPAECSQELQTQNAATGFSTAYSGTTSSGSC